MSVEGFLGLEPGFEFLLFRAFVQFQSWVVESRNLSVLKPPKGCSYWVGLKP